MIKEQFTPHFAMLQKMFGHVVTDDIRRLYWEQLKLWDEQKFKKAIEGICSSFIPSRQVPFPLLPHFLEAVGEDNESRARNAVLKIKEAAMRVGRNESISFGVG